MSPQAEVVPRIPRRLLPPPALVHVLCFIAAFVAPSALAAQPATVTVRTVLRDSVSGQPVADGVVELRGANSNRSETVDRSGAAVFSRVAPGSYTVATIRVGYRPRLQPLVVGARDTTFVLTVVAIPTELARVRVRASTQELFGVVGGLPNLSPVVGARVKLEGAERATTTDSAGHYTLAEVKPGDYVLRITAPGFVDRMTFVTLPRGKAVESSHLLDVDRGAARANGIALGDMESRLAFRGLNSAIVSGEELHRHGGTVTTALQQSREVATKGLQLSGPVCVFLNGRPMPGWPLDGLDSDGVAFVEVYGSRGDPTGSLAQRWPRGAACSATATLAGTRATSASVGYIVVWTK